MYVELPCLPDELYWRTTFLEAVEAKELVFGPGLDPNEAYTTKLFSYDANLHSISSPNEGFLDETSPWRTIL